MECEFSSVSNDILVKDAQICYPDSANPSVSLDELQLASGQCLVLCGPSGSGKSSFLKVINALIPNETKALVKGEWLFGGQDMTHSSLENRARKVASVFQDPESQFFHKKVLQELVFPCENQGLSREKITERLEQTTTLFQLKSLLEKEIVYLSGGQKQVIAVATATMQGTDVILFDEPTANLDQRYVNILADYLKRLKAEGKTLIIADHRLSYLSQVADAYLYFEKGKKGRYFSRKAFLQLSDKHYHDMGLRSSDTQKKWQLVQEMATHFSNDKTGLMIENLTVTAQGKRLYQIPQLTISSGQIVGVIGKNGSGKTQLSRYLSGLLSDSRAKISWQGQKLSQRDCFKTVAYVMQDIRMQLFSESVRTELLLGQASQKIDDSLLQAFHLDDLLERHPQTLSVGEQQRLLIVAALMADKPILIFDEPSSGLDYDHMQILAKHLEHLKEQGKLILLISHDEELLSDVCDKILSLEQFS